MTIKTLDHLVLTTSNLKECIRFYQDILGMHHQLSEVVDRVGARGKMKSIYMYDPDGNLVELAQYV